MNPSFALWLFLFSCLSLLKAIGAPPVELAAEPRAEVSRQMVEEVRAAWRPPTTEVAVPAEAPADPATAELETRLDTILIPELNFSGMELGRVANVLSHISRELDAAEHASPGVNIVVLDPANTDPVLNLTLRHLSLRRVLDFVTRAVGYHYEVQADAVVIRPGGASGLETEFFAVSRPTVMRMTGQLARSAGESPPPGTGSGDASHVIQTFLQLAGVDFAQVPGSTLAFDGSQLIVTQTPPNLARIRNLLARYRDVRQVQIEAKFMEVQQGALEELGVQWNLADRSSLQEGSGSAYTTGGGVNRSLAEAFRNSTSSQQISISGDSQAGGGLSLPAAAPMIPGGVLLGAAAGPLAGVTRVLGEFDVNAVLRALAQKSGTELLSAPKVTVLSGHLATITIAQELRYPQSYGQIQSQVGTGSLSGGGSAGVSITSGTPQEFTTRNIGVELRVTPTVEEDNRSVSLDLNPKVTEFEGFVEYGGPSVAISGGTTVTIPPGFYQPIFAVREITTRVTLWNGATLMMGGLTREDVKKVHDKVPILGSVPIIGRLFRSKGESTQKRNLLIFVTANLVNPGGVPQP